MIDRRINTIQHQAEILEQLEILRETIAEQSMSTASISVIRVEIARLEKMIKEAANR